MTAGVYDNCYICWNGCPTDAGDKGSRLSSYRAEPDGVGVTSNTQVADIDIEIARVRCASFDNWLSSSIKYLRCM